MKELVLIHPVGKSKLSSFRETETQSWTRTDQGDYVLRPAGETDEYLIPASNVKYERRARPSKAGK